MFQEKPYFMENENWYSHNEKKFMYELTAEAPLMAIDSYYYFYAAFDDLEVKNIYIKICGFA